MKCGMLDAASGVLKIFGRYERNFGKGFKRNWLILLEKGVLALLMRNIRIDKLIFWFLLNNNDSISRDWLICSTLANRLNRSHVEILSSQNKTTEILDSLWMVKDKRRHQRHFYKTSFRNLLIKMVSSETILFFNTRTLDNELNGNFVKVMSSYTVYSSYFSAENGLKFYQMRPFPTVSKKWCEWSCFGVR